MIEISDDRTWCETFYDFFQGNLGKCTLTCSSYFTALVAVLTFFDSFEIAMRYGSGSSQYYAVSIFTPLVWCLISVIFTLISRKAILVEIADFLSQDHILPLWILFNGVCILCAGRFESVFQDAFAGVVTALGASECALGVTKGLLHFVNSYDYPDEHFDIVENYDVEVQTGKGEIQINDSKAFPDNEKIVKLEEYGKELPVVSQDLKSEKQNQNQYRSASPSMQDVPNEIEPTRLASSIHQNDLPKAEYRESDPTMLDNQCVPAAKRYPMSIYDMEDIQIRNEERELLDEMASVSSAGIQEVIDGFFESTQADSEEFIIEN